MLPADGILLHANIVPAPGLNVEMAKWSGSGHDCDSPQKQQLHSLSPSPARICIQHQIQYLPILSSFLFKIVTIIITTIIIIIIIINSHRVSSNQQQSSLGVFYGLGFLGSWGLFAFLHITSTPASEFAKRTGPGKEKTRIITIIPSALSSS